MHYQTFLNRLLATVRGAVLNKHGIQSVVHSLTHIDAAADVISSGRRNGFFSFPSLVSCDSCWLFDMSVLDVHNK